MKYEFAHIINLNETFLAQEFGIYFWKKNQLENESEEHYIKARSYEFYLWFDHVSKKQDPLEILLVSKLKVVLLFLFP